MITDDKLTIWKMWKPGDAREDQVAEEELTEEPAPAGTLYCQCLVLAVNHLGDDI